MAIDLNRYIAKIRAEPGRNFLALALQEIQDKWPTPQVSSVPSPTPTPSSTGGGVPAASVVSTSFKLYVGGVLSTKNSGNLNSSNPAPPDGFVNVGFREDNTLPIPGITAYSPNVGYVNNQIGTTYTVLTSDFGKLLIFTNAAAVAVTIDVSTLPSNFFCGIASFGAGGLTITPASGTIDGSASLALANLQGLPVYSDGTDLWTERGLGSSSSGTVTEVDTSAPLTGGPITATGTIGITEADTSTDGYLSSTDWNTFNDKQAAINFIDAEAVTFTGTAFTLAHTPIAGSLQLVKVPSGSNPFPIFLVGGGVNYSLSGASGTLVASPDAGDSGVAWYRW